MSSPPVPVVDPPEPPQALTLVCANCGAALEGKYCAACGQRHEPHLHTVAHFAAEALESISHADSRLWKSLWYLVSRPGFLTREFFEGRRARYLPPFRLYLVISVLFFLVAGVPKDAEIIRIDSEPPAAGTARSGRGVAFEIDTSKDDAAAGARKEMQDAAAEVGAAVSAATREKLAAAKEQRGVSTGVRDFCDEFRDQADSNNTARNNLRDRCRQIASDNGRELAASIVHNLPRAMFIFLPLLAFIMKLMYWRPKRYYVEHLLYLIHNHAFVFLVLTVLVLFARIRYVGAYVGWLWAAAVLYTMWYVFRGMRNYYQQGRPLTLAKYFTLGLAYIMMTFTVLLLTAIYSAIMA